MANCFNESSWFPSQPKKKKKKSYIQISISLPIVCIKSCAKSSSNFIEVL